jgi:hypothetical protein
MTILYPRERVKEVLRPLSLAKAHRIVLKRYLSEPLTVRPSKSRFCDGRSYAVLYAAGDFATAFAEVVVRDRLVQRDRRLVPFGDIAARGWVELPPGARRLVPHESRELIRGQRFAEVVSLCLIAALCLEKRELLGSLHALGGRVQTETIGQIDDRTHDAPVLRVLSDPAHERLIDLELVGVKALQVIQ